LSELLWTHILMADDVRNAKPVKLSNSGSPEKC